MIRVSVGTAHVLGLKKLLTDAPPTTAYLLAGERCFRDCSFCPQAFTSTGRADMLSRIIWPEYVMEQVTQGIKAAAESAQIKRACLQVVKKDEAMTQAEELLQKIKLKTDVPVCLSCNISAPEEGERLIDLGADKVGIALDCVSEAIYPKIKGGSLRKQLQLIYNTAQLIPGRVSTHLIVGLGETEEEMVQVMAKMVDWGVTIGLFAFTPVKGTKDQDKKQPDLGCYRRMQVAQFLLEERISQLTDFNFQAGVLVSFGVEKEQLINYLSSGKAFQTTGCPDCNRPYYNEKPGGIIYNYPRPLTPGEIEEALILLGLLKKDGCHEAKMACN